MTSVSRRVRVITDSTADIPHDLVSRWGIEVVPLFIHFGSESFRDGVDMPLGRFLERLSQGEFPTTAQPAVETLKRVYAQAVTGGGEAISIHLSSGLSGTYGAALLAADQVDGQVAVVDSGLFSMGLGWLVLAAAEAAREGCSLQEVTARVEEMRSRTHVLALIESLEHLRRGGRIGQAQVALGSLLDVRPIVGLQSGRVALFERTRTRRAGLRRLVETVAAAGPLERAAVLHAGCPEDAAQIAEALRPLLPRERILVLPGGQVTITHLGLQAVGVCFVVGQPGDGPARPTGRPAAVSA